MNRWKHGPKPVIGLIGAIGAGKTTVATALKARCAEIINADAIGHEALEQPDVRKDLVSRWGQRIVRQDGKLDRRAIGGIVFADSCERTALERRVFPYIGERINQQILRAQHDPTVRFIVVDAAVMLEAGWNTACDRIVYIDAPRDLRMTRLATRSGWTANELALREAAQWSEADKRRQADGVLVNDGTLEQLQNRIDAILREWNIPSH